MKLLVSISDQPGTGKTTLQNNLTKCGWAKVLTLTTQPKRAEETGDEYIYCQKEEIEGSKCLWSVEIEGNLYATREKEIEEAFGTASIAVIVITPDYHKRLRRECSQLGIKHLPIHLLSPAIKKLEERLVGRGEDRVKARQRLSDTSTYLSQAITVESIICLPPENSHNLVKSVLSLAFKFEHGLLSIYYTRSLVPTKTE